MSKFHYINKFDPSAAPKLPSVILYNIIPASAYKMAIQAHQEV